MVVSQTVDLRGSEVLLPLGQGQTADVLGAVCRLNAIALVGLLVEEVGVDEEGGGGDQSDRVDDEGHSGLVLSIVAHSSEELVEDTIFI